MARRKVLDDGPGLFDDPDPPRPESDWEEVPQARFDSWPEAMQLAYCAARDYDSAEHADDVATQKFYIERADLYSKRLDALKGKA
jgi:hypothetical protein